MTSLGLWSVTCQHCPLESSDFIYVSSCLTRHSLWWSSQEPFFHLRLQFTQKPTSILIEQPYLNNFGTMKLNMPHLSSVFPIRFVCVILPLLKNCEPEKNYHCMLIIVWLVKSYFGHLLISISSNKILVCNQRTGDHLEKNHSFN